MSRIRFFIPLFALLLAPTFVSAQAEFAVADDPVTLTAETQKTITSAEVLQGLIDGNARFVDGERINRDYLAQVQATATGQYPSAVVLGCIDSRVPPEIVFDQGVGDIFSARVAGNFINTDILGSMEFATAVAGSKVIVVLGHTSCGAVKGACDNVELGNLTQTLSNIAPAVYAVTDIEGERTSQNAEFVQAVADMNVELTVQNILDRSPIIRGLVESGDVLLVGAMHDVTTGQVTFHEPVTVN
ncbi:MAG: carbonic anhydrase family protein [Bacteroidota bacterium]